MDNNTNNKTQKSWNWKKIRKMLGHVGLLLAVSIYTVIGALVSIFLFNKINKFKLEINFRASN